MKGNKLLLTGLLSVGALFALGRWGAYRMWRKQGIERVTRESSVIETRLGPIEYCVSGQGPAVVIAHGSPGGYDQAVAFARLVGGNDFRFISLSRPGYLRTPLASGATPAEQADLYAGLLDALGIERAAVIGVSGGGPSALQFALRHPDYCNGLVMVSGIVQRYTEPDLERALTPLKRLGRRIVNRLAIFDPFIFLLLPITNLFRDEGITAALLQSSAFYHLRKAGYENDLEQFAAITDCALEEIELPTLVVHGTADEEVSFEDAKLLASKVNGVKLFTIDGGNHVIFYTHAKTIIPVVYQFLQDIQRLKRTHRIDIDLPTGGIEDAQEAV